MASNERNVSDLPMDDIFGGKLNESRKEVGTSRWYFPTNHINAKSIVGAGTVRSSRLARSNFADLQHLDDGWIPIFRDKVPADAQEISTAQKPQLRVCAFQIDLENYEGACKFQNANGHLQSASLAEVRESGSEIVFIPSGIASPRTLIFKTALDSEEFKSNVASTGNVNIDGLSILVDGSVFGIADGHLSLPAPLELKFDASISQRAQSLGGIIANLFHLSNRSDVALSAFQSIVSVPGANQSSLLESDAILARLPAWVDAQINARAGIADLGYFWSIVDAIAEAKGLNQPLQPKDVVIKFLRTLLELEKVGLSGRQRLSNLIEDLENVIGFSQNTVTELLQRHETALSRSLLLFCLRDSSKELLEFSNPLIRDNELVIASILFGARDGWIALPRELKQPHSLAEFVEHRMAHMERLASGVSLSMRDDISAPTPLRARIPSVETELTSKQKEVVLKIARARKWNDCIQTIFGLPNGNYTLNSTSSGLQLILDGDVKSVSTKLKMEVFRNRALSEDLKPAEERSLREAFPVESFA